MKRIKFQRDELAIQTFLLGSMIFAVLVCFLPTVQAADFIWDGSTANWFEQWLIQEDPDVYRNHWGRLGYPTPLLPTATDNVYIDSGNASSSVVYLDGIASIHNLSIDTSDTLIINSGRSLTLFGNNLANSGLLELYTTNSTNLIFDSNVTLNGGGEVKLSNSAGYSYLQGTGINRLTNVNNTIHGEGKISYDDLAITNQGLIKADTAKTLTIDPANAPADGQAGVINAGTLQATDGGTLIMQGGSFNNAGGIIEALDASVVNLGSLADITGGTLRTTGTGVIQSTGSGSSTPVLSNLTNEGYVLVPSSKDLGLQGTITNTGSFEVQTSSTSILNILGDVTLNGGGEVKLSNSAGVSYLRGTGDNRLTNVNNTIHGEGRISYDDLAVTNQGLIKADTAKTLTIDPTDAPADGQAGVINTGTLQAVDGGTLILQGGSFNNTGGVIEALDASIVNLGALADITGGTLRTTGTGVIQSTGSGSSTPVLTNLTNEGYVLVTNGKTLGLQGTITNTGSFEVQTSSTSILNILGDVTLNGGGEVKLSNSAGVSYLRGTGDNRLTNVNNTIHGEGRISYDDLAVTNQGLIKADTAKTLTIDPTDAPTDGQAGVINTGTLQAVDGGTLILQGGSFNNTGGVIEALDSSIVNLGALAEITGGTLRTAGTGVIQSAGSGTSTPILTNLTNEGYVLVPTGKALGLQGTITNTGCFEVQTSSASVINILGNMTLNGGGELKLSGTAGYSYVKSEGVNSLTNVNNTIHGKGKIDGQVLNQGTVQADVSGAYLYFNPTDSGFINQGTVQAIGGGRLIINSAALFENRSTLFVDSTSLLTANGGLRQSTGTTTVDGSITVNSGSLLIEGGNLKGTGTIVGNVINVDGAIHPGHSAGRLTINGDFTQQDETDLYIQLGGSTPSDDYDQLTITGEANLDGYLNLGVFEDYTPTLGDTFVVMTYDSRVGTFDRIFGWNLEDGTFLSVAYNANDITVQIRTLIPGDANLDGMVDVGDLGILAANYGTLSGAYWEVGDFNADGMVDVGDLGILAANYGTGSSGANFDADYAKVFGEEVAEDNVDNSGSVCATLGLPIVAGLLFMGLMLVKFED